MKQRSNILRTSSLIFVSSFLSLSALSVDAQKKRSPIKFNASIGYKYDSNVTVDEIDTNAARSDNITKITSNLSYKKKFAKKFTFSVGAGINQSLHEQFSQFNVQVRKLNSSLSYKADKTTYGLNGYIVDTTLDKNGFLSFKAISPSISHYITPKIYTRLAYTRADKTFDNRAERDAITDTFSADIYRFIDSANHYVSLGIKHKNENTLSPFFDFTSNTIKARWVKKAKFLGKRTKFSISGSWEDRQYDNEGSITNGIRHDDRKKIAASISYPLSKQLSLQANYEYSDFTSNLTTVDYTQHMAGLTIRFDL